MALTVGYYVWPDGAHAVAGCGSMTILRFAEAPEIGVIHVDVVY